MIFRNYNFTRRATQKEFAMLKNPKILMLSSDPAESCVLERILRDHATIRFAANLSELRDALNVERGVHDYDTVLCGFSFHRGDRQQAINEIHDVCPDSPPVICGGNGMERDWAEVLQAGGLALLNTPYTPETLLPTPPRVAVSYSWRGPRKARNLIPTVS
jgi:DNA-binding NtrC family response regulator